ncbi:MAG: UDP-N-acetylglucosamine pyrophosphorylase [Ruminococcaceae bacterium]|nr:UDP-N-acetylglucosamine pyrophosphorylase [Oscillospiraceae bacterium]
MINIFNALNFFDLSKSMAGDFLSGYEKVWDALPDIKEFVTSLGKSLDKNIYDEIKENVWVAKSAKVAPTAFIDAPCIVGEDSEIRHSAFIRGSVLIGKSCVVGNSTEMKNSIIFDNVQIPHYNYVGDSILGYRSHLGAGAVTSNVKSDKTLVTIKCKDEKIETNLKKFGAIVGDFTEVGCGSVLCPGSVIGKDSIIYPLSRVRGFIEEKSIFKDENNIVKKQEKSAR